MSMGFSNVYADAKRAEAYSKLEFPGTYYLAYRDLPQIIFRHVKDKNALDFGCGTGRSTRFLKKLGFDVVGVDIAEDMIKKAKELDSTGDYRLIIGEDFSQFREESFDLVLSAFTFDNIPTMERKVRIFKGLAALLKREGRVINLVSAPEIYAHEWASFSTKDFPENRLARCGDKVRIIQTDTEDKRPVEDIIWTDQCYREVFRDSDLEPVETYRPLGKEGEGCDWVNETKIAPWTIYVVMRKQTN